MQLDPLPGFRVHPSAKNAAAWKHERMRAIPIYDGEL
jgi:hypothetical protein